MWSTDIKEWTGMRTFGATKRRAEDRCNWRSMVANALIEYGSQEEDTATLSRPSGRVPLENVTIRTGVRQTVKLSINTAREALGTAEDEID